MISLYITGQTLRIYSPLIAADSINYLTAKAEFADSSWDGYNKWVHFRKGDTVYDIALNNRNEITSSSALNLTAGDWQVYLTGTLGTSRLTSSTAALTVRESGLIDAPLHALPQSVAEVLDAKSTHAINTANSVKQRADNGEFNGADGKSFVIKGYVTSSAQLPATGNESDMYGVGASSPYDLYAWDNIGSRWVNNGNMVIGPSGAAGAAGKYAVPTLDQSGNLSWAWSDSSTGGLPAQQNIRGATGAQGQTGTSGKSAYQAAQDGGYTGDEQSFNSKLGTFDAHAASHSVGGSDELQDGAITRAKLADGAVTSYFSGTLTTGDWTGTEAPYTQAVTVTGIAATDKAKIGVLLSSTFATAIQENKQWGYILDADTSANTITFRAKIKPDVALSFQAEVNRK